jgi:hypothetical protein
LPSIFKNFPSSNDVEGTDPYTNIANDITEEVVFLGSGQKAEDSSVSNPERDIEEKELQVFCDARHKALYYNGNRKVLCCRKCNSELSPIDLVDNTL